MPKRPAPNEQPKIIDAVSSEFIASRPQWVEGPARNSSDHQPGLCDNREPLHDFERFSSLTPCQSAHRQFLISPNRRWCRSVRELDGGKSIPGAVGSLH
jgi:hypothetical protein